MPAKTHFGPFLGLNNRRPDDQLREEERGRATGNYLKNAINVDITSEGTLVRRKGVELMVAATQARSLWCDGTTMLCAVGGDLCIVGEDASLTVIKSGLIPSLPISYTSVPGFGIVWSNGVEIEKVVDGVSMPLGPTQPSPAPTVAVSTGGSLPEGQYQVAVSAVDANGVESPLSWPVAVDVPEGGVVVLSDLPALANVYMTTVNGENLFLVQQASVSLTISVLPDKGAQPPTLHTAAMPPGTLVRYYNGRLIAVQENLLMFSEPFAYHLFNPLQNFIPFPSPITVVETLPDGFYVVSDVTYWSSADDPVNDEKANMRVVLPYGAVARTGGELKRSKEVYWYSTKGLVVGAAGGQARNVQEASVEPDSAAQGAQLYREQNGMRQVLSSLFNPSSSTASANSFMEAEVIRKGN